MFNWIWLKTRLNLTSTNVDQHAQLCAMKTY